MGQSDTCNGQDKADGVKIKVCMTVCCNEPCHAPTNHGTIRASFLGGVGRPKDRLLEAHESATSQVPDETMQKRKKNTQLCQPHHDIAGYPHPLANWRAGVRRGRTHHNWHLNGGQAWRWEPKGDMKTGWAQKRWCPGPVVRVRMVSR
jgi:hypothetical protein